MRQAERAYWEARALRSIVTRDCGPLTFTISAFVPPGEIQMRDQYRIVGRLTNIGDMEDVR